MKKKRLLPMFLLSFGVVSFVSAQTPAYESFDYELGSVLIDQGSDDPGFSSGWEMVNGNTSDFTIEEGVAHEGLKTVGGRLFHNNTSGNTGTWDETRCKRTLTDTYTDDGGEIWISLLMEYGEGMTTNTWMGLNFASALIGRDWGYSNFTFTNWNIDKKFDTGVSSEQQAWLVACFQMSGNADDEQVYMWVNPDPATKPSEDDAVVNTTMAMNDGFDGFALLIGRTGELCQYVDELRLGKQWNDVTSPETPVITLSADQIVGVSNFGDRIEFDCNLSQPVKICIYDVNGKLVTTLISSDPSSMLVWNTSEVQKGVYVYKLSSGDVNESGKVAVY